MAYTRPGQYFVGLSPLYYAFHMRNPALIEGFHASEYTRPQQVIELIDALQSHRVPLIVIRQSNDFLRATASPADHLTLFRIYLSRNYQVVRNVATGDDVWWRIEAVAPAPLKNKPVDESKSGAPRREGENRALNP
jgi:hypothetical protein